VGVYEFKGQMTSAKVRGQVTWHMMLEEGWMMSAKGDISR